MSVATNPPACARNVCLTYNVTIGLSGKVLPVHPQPKPDEIFSSWYCRVAQENNLKLHTLEVQLWGRDKQIWTRDIDRSIDDETLSEFARVCGTSFERARETCLQSYEGILFQTLNRNGNSNWVLSAGIFHRKRKLGGMQYCGLCLATDEKPYFRKSWRLALSTYCDLHSVMLRDRCPKCSASVMFHRQELGKRWEWEVSSLSICTSCGFDLKYSGGWAAPVFDIHAWNALQAQRFFLDLGWTFAGGQDFQYSHLYFDVLRNLIQKLLSSLTPRHLLKIAKEHLSISDDWILKGAALFEMNEVMGRHCILQIATWLLLDWPNRFVALAKESNVRYSELMRDFDSSACWFVEGARVIEFNPVGVSDGERDEMRRLITDAAGDDIRLDWLIKSARERTGYAVSKLWPTGFPDRGADDNDNPAAAALALLAARLGFRQKQSVKGSDKAGLSKGQRIAVVASKTATSYGIRMIGLSKSDLKSIFPVASSEVKIEIDDLVHAFSLGDAFWEHCPEIRGAAIKDWLRRRHALEWQRLHPPSYALIFLGRRRFRLVE